MGEIELDDESETGLIVALLQETARLRRLLDAAAEAQAKAEDEVRYWRTKCELAPQVARQCALDCGMSTMAVSHLHNTLRYRLRDDR